MRREALLPIFSVLGASVIWGSAYTTNKITLGYGSPALHEPGHLLRMLPVRPLPEYPACLFRAA